MYEILKKVEEDQLKKSYMNLEMKGSSSIIIGWRGQDGAKVHQIGQGRREIPFYVFSGSCLLYTSDAADDC